MVPHVLPDDPMGGGTEVNRSEECLEPRCGQQEARQTEMTGQVDADPGPRWQSRRERTGRNEVGAGVGWESVSHDRPKYTAARSNCRRGLEGKEGVRPSTGRCLHVVLTDSRLAHWVLGFWFWFFHRGFPASKKMLIEVRTACLNTPPGCFQKPLKRRDRVRGPPTGSV